jgi:hypothetical protein
LQPNFSDDLAELFYQELATLKKALILPVWDSITCILFPVTRRFHLLYWDIIYLKILLLKEKKYNKHAAWIA